MLDKLIVKTVAKEFLLEPQEYDLFDATWALFDRLARPKGDKAKAAKKARESKLVGEAWVNLHKATLGKPTGQLGQRYVTRKPVSGSYVIFSDHHVAYDGHRHNFFRTSGNLALYVELLGHYLEGGYTLVENGDVEDLVVYDPGLEKGEAVARQKLSLNALNARRRVTRLAQLDNTLSCAGNQPWVARLRQFDDERRLIRVAGNHDYDLQKPLFYKRLKTAYPQLERPADYLFLTKADGSPSHVIMHGHQFDKNTHPKLAPRYGETISECLGVWFQGPDRKWYFNDPPDGPREWGAGKRRFLDELVVDGFKQEKGWANVFQRLFQRNIAWNYFKHKNAMEAIVYEVAEGVRFFKFRHLNEEDIRYRLQHHFTDAKRPTLILGHSHEPRLLPRSPKTGKLVRHYANTGSAGLFQNLIWGIEVVNGVMTMVSWRRLSDGSVERRPWLPQTDGGRRRLVAQAPATLA